MMNNNKDILTVPLEELRDEDREIIGKALEELQNKCFMSYYKTRDNKVIQKYPLPRILMHGQSDTNEADDRWFFVDSINKAIRDAMQEHNTTFLDAFDNTMMEVFYGQAGPAYYHIPHPLTQGTMQTGASHQGAAQTRGNNG